MSLDRARAVAALIRDVLLVALMLAFIFVGVKALDSVHHEFYKVPSGSTPTSTFDAPDDTCGGGVC